MNWEGIAQGCIGVEGRLTADSYIELTFTSHGPAIPRERWEAIFNLFSACEVETEGLGAGLGLWGARTTLRAHEGDVCVLESNEERTVFLLRLPANQEGTGS
jgi:K+-sensing histidine kinase KdpD